MDKLDKEMIRDYELDIIVKAWRDEPFRKSLLSNPKKAIEKEFGISIPKGTEVFVHEERADCMHLIVPSVPSNFDSEDFSDDELKDVIGGVMSTGHLASLPRTKDRVRLREYQQEINKLQNELAKLKKS